MIKRCIPIVVGLLVAACGSVSIAPPEPGDVGADDNMDNTSKIHTNAFAIPNQYIVVLDDADAEVEGASFAGVESLALSMAAQYGVGSDAVLNTYQHALRGFTVAMSEDQALALLDDPRVLYVEQDSTVTIDATQSGATWGIDRIDQASLPLNGSYQYDYTGSGVHAYIVDTGMNTSHNEFSGRVGNGYSAISGGPEDCNGHGTHVAGTVGGTTYGVAKGVTLHPVRVLSCSGSGSTSGVISGVDWVTANHQSPAVANMSLGGGASNALDDAIEAAIDSGVTFAVAAGNENSNACSGSPSRVDAALTVGSTTSSDSRSSFSNKGSCVDIFAPGSGITSAWYSSNSATNTISGTSMASPHVAGAAALYLEAYPGSSPAEVFNGLVDSAASGKISNVGGGSPNLLLQTTFDGSGGGGGGGDTPTPTPTPDPTDPCPGCEHYAGTLYGTGDYEYQPNGTYYFASSGTHNAWLEGAGTDFDLYLWKWNGSNWQTVASSTSPTSSEAVSYSGSSGYYAWRIYSYSGSGGYDFWLDRP